MHLTDTRPTDDQALLWLLYLLLLVPSKFPQFNAPSSIGFFTTAIPTVQPTLGQMSPTGTRFSLPLLAPHNPTAFWEVEDRKE